MRPDTVRPLAPLVQRGLIAALLVLAVVGWAVTDERMAGTPSLEHLDSLVAHVREAGLPVEMRVEGEPAPVPAWIDISAYRIVQEALTNALRHAEPARARVVVRYGEVEVEVADDGRGPDAGDGTGHGLVGMRERAPSSAAS